MYYPPKVARTYHLLSTRWNDIYGLASSANHCSCRRGEANITGPAVLASLLDRLLYRHPFEGRSARRYADKERPAFESLDDRILDGLELEAARTFLDLGCGPATFAQLVRRRHPQVEVTAIDPSRDFGTAPGVIRARGEDLPLVDRSIDVALCLSSIRHVQDRRATLRELRRVVRGRLVIVELDPEADRTRIAAHASRLDGALLRRVFGPLVVKTAPTVRAITRLAVEAGFSQVSLRADPIQPVYILELR